MMVSDELILRIEAGGEPVIVIRPIDVVLDILFAAPDDLHRPVNLLCDRNGLGDAVHVEPAAKAAAEQMIVHLDLVGREPSHLRGRSLRAGHHLDSDPNIAAVLGDVHRAIHRLHGSVRQERHLVDGFDLPGCARYCLGEVALATGHDAVVLRGACHLLHDAGRGDIRVGALVPFDVEGTEPLHRGPHMVADHRHGIVDLDHLPHAFDRHCLAVVDAFELAAKDGTCGHARKLHAGNHRVDTEPGLAVHFLGRIEALGRRPDEGEVLGVLERDLVRHWQLGCGVNESSVIELLPRR
jgi:hypothetical protein